MWVETVPGGKLTFSAAATAVSASFNGSDWNVMVSVMSQFQSVWVLPFIDSDATIHTLNLV